MLNPIHVDVLGQGADTVLLIHGTPTAPRDMLPLGEALASGRRVLVPHLPGYGLSPALAVQGMDGVVDALVAALGAHAVSSVHVVGFSGGAYLALRLALDARVRVLSVTTLGGFAGLAPAHRDGLRAAAEPLERGVVDADSMPALMLSAAHAARNPQHVEAVKRWPRAVPPGWPRGRQPGVALAT